MLLILCAVSALGIVVWLLARCSSSFHERRSILAHVDADRAWAAVRHLPELLDRHGRRETGLHVEDWVLRRGDGSSAGSIWRAQGALGASPYWADVEILQFDPRRIMAFRLVHDARGTHRGLRDHSGTLRIDEVRPGVVKISWSLHGGLRSLRLRALRLLSRRALRPRLLDLSLRSLILAVESTLLPEPAVSGDHVERGAANRPTVDTGSQAVPARDDRPTAKPRHPSPGAEA